MTTKLTLDINFEDQLNMSKRTEPENNTKKLA